MLNLHERRLGQERERARVARELHDGICQELASIKFQIEANIIKLGIPEQFASAQEALKRIPTKLSNTLDKVRQIMENLHPAILRDLGLEASLCQLIRKPVATKPIKINFCASCEIKSLDEDAKTALYRIAQEALNNTQQHANAHQVDMRLESDSHWVTLTIRDDGVGINGSSKSGSGRGIPNMRERLEEIGGKLTINSLLQGTRGTEVIATIRRT
jgi:two-component system NarL family sensor kinase